LHRAEVAATGGHIAATIGADALAIRRPARAIELLTLDAIR
jgi:hypothetical protein